MALKNHDFISIEYNGYIAESNSLFDTTNAEEAKKHHLHNPNMTYGPMVICLGERHILKGIDDHLIGKEPENTYEFTIKPDAAFGKKDAKLMRLVPRSVFKQQNVQPMVGLEINVDGLYGLIRTVSGGRIIVDFNHPLAGKEVRYEVKVGTIITDDAEKVKGLVQVMLNTKDAAVELKEGKALITLKQDIPKEIQELLKQKIVGLVPMVKEISLTKTS